MQQPWETLPLNELIDLRPAVFGAYYQAQRDARLDATLVEHERHAMERRLAYQHILTKRLAELTFTEQLENLVEAYALDPNSNRSVTYHQLIQARLLFLFYNDTLARLIASNDVDSFSKYNIPLIMQDIAQWIVFNAPPEINFEYEPTFTDIEVRTGHMNTTQHDYKTQLLLLMM
jgi:hypothetical protein